MPQDNGDRAKRKRELQERQQSAMKRMSARTTSIKFQTDTLSTYNYFNTADAYYEPNTGRIVSNVKGGEKEVAKTKVDIAHEAKHASNAKLGIPNVSVEQFYTLSVLDEVSAHTVSALAWREEYLKAPDKEQFLDEQLNRNLSNINVPLSYMEAIRDGKINPESKSSADFEKEMKFLVKEEAESITSSYGGYEKQFKSGARLYINSSDGNFASNDKEFERHAKHYMTIGGLDFRKYLPDNYQEQIKVPAEIQNASKDMASNGKAERAQIVVANGLPYDGSVSLEQYYNLLQHKEIANNIMYNIEDSDLASLKAGENDADYGIQSSYDIFKSKSQYSKEFVEANMDYAFHVADGNVPDNEAAYQQKLKEIYTIPGTDIDLRNHLNNFSVEDIPYKDYEAINEFVKDPEKYKAEHPYKNIVEGKLEYHEGEPEWAQPTDDSRVSDVQTMDVMDSESDFLAAELEKRRVDEELQKIKEQEEKERLEKEKQAQAQAVEPLTTAPQITKGQFTTDGKTYTYDIPVEQYKNVEIKSIINEKGERIDYAMIDGRKHGLATLKDENGNIKEVKAFDHGKEIDLSKHNLEIKEDTKEVNGHQLKRSLPILDGKPFGAVTVTDENGKTKADFYDAKGQRMTGQAGAKITKKTEMVNTSGSEVSSNQPVSNERPVVEDKIEEQTKSEPEVKPVQTQQTSEEVPVEQAESKQQEQQQPTEQHETTSSEEEQSYEQRVTDSLQAGHSRVAAMRAKLHAGHEENKVTAYENSKSSAIERLRFETSTRPTAVVKRPLTAEAMYKLLKDKRVHS